MEDITYLMGQLNLNKKYIDLYFTMNGIYFKETKRIKDKNGKLKIIVGINEEQGFIGEFSLRKNGKHFFFSYFSFGCWVFTIPDYRFH